MNSVLNAPKFQTDEEARAFLEQVLWPKARSARIVAS
jgi:hypothetical protein